MMQAEKQALIKGAQQMSVMLSPEQADQLLAFLALLHKWNKTYNLTAIKSIDQMLTHHLLDSLSIAPHLSGETVVDVGCGAGLPGLPLAIFFPEKQFTLIDSVGKKIRFINQVIRSLSLKNVTAVHSRAEDFGGENQFDMMTARAVGSMAYLLPMAKHLLKSHGYLLAMKSDLSEEALSEVPENAQVIRLTVPGVQLGRHLYVCPIN